MSLVPPPAAPAAAHVAAKAMLMRQALAALELHQMQAALEQMEDSSDSSSSVGVGYESDGHDGLTDVGSDLDDTGRDASARMKRPRD